MFECLVSLTRRMRLLFKIPSTWQGIEASSLLEYKGLQTHLTFVYSFCQAAAAAQIGASVIQIFVVHIRDWARNHSGDPEIKDALKRGKGLGLALQQFGTRLIISYHHTIEDIAISQGMYHASQ
ncbi:hypothetical protein F0562_012805 [Nyssa sinensis]|uniref:Transaldolase n=1 Tax=Nyssa sinensis TaxID=561372 RepID=A0A5J4ZXU7_9ASTE|nr:hypothetical protein F0562_012805 [Nyssa sinensis]